MLEIYAKLADNLTLLAGDSITCLITIANKSIRTHLNVNGGVTGASSPEYDCLAWATAQLLCVCSINPSKVKLMKPLVVQPQNISSNSTSLSPAKDETGHVIYCSTPHILVCDLSLAPGEKVSFKYEEKLPTELPPSYRGQALKYSYKLKIGLQRLQKSVKVLHLPIRVLVCPGISDGSLLVEEDELITVPSNPFLNSQRRDQSLDSVWQHAQAVLSRRVPSLYRVTKGSGKVVSVCLYKPNFRLGEDIIATLDFFDATVPCLQFSVTLQSEEVLDEAYRLTASQLPAIVSHTQQHEVCMGLQHCSVALPVPVHLTPSFSTYLVQLRWRLHFEFVTSSVGLDSQLEATDSIKDKSKGTAVWHGPTSLPIETLVWDLPLQLYAPYAAHLTMESKTAREACIRM